ncbi:helix-turn-helix transcriptional regulator [Paenibacillus alvei]|uniref:helix-turn-helix domain-containing protein n=1 Tax=Paenibacillus alvei TaxID=44250 RepID=UPI00227E69DC|nr:helix-turn-helix transcriptional regulator [Paenibacillus alvei]MCY9754001.1 helix-turn-helix transcriptional regulator [Paenibacillus alvei]
MLAQRLLYQRQEKKKTQAEMASLLGITRQAYGYYEKGEREPDNESLNKLADFFGVTTDYLLGRTDIPTPITDKQPSNQEDDEFEAFINDPQHGIFFKEYLEAPEERKKELMQFWRIIKEAEKGRNLGDRQGE